MRIARLVTTRRRLVLWGILGLLVTIIVVAAVYRDEWAAWGMVRAPNYGCKLDSAGEPDASGMKKLGVDRALDVAVGPPAASLAVRVIDPPTAAPPRGTILFLHGIRDRKESILETARSHARRGYRAIVADSRGHGESSGDWITYGVVEARDYVQLIDELERRGLIAGKLGVYGVSFGGSIGIQLAARDPRVATVVAISPFRSLRTVVPSYAKIYTPLATTFGTDWLGRAIRRAGQLAQFNPDEADTEAAIQRTRAPVLLIHGRNDSNIPCQHSQTLHDAAPDHSELFIVDGEDHVTLTWDRTLTIWKNGTAWFDRWLAGP
jgi:pimeloyl-ACP methyl ester carboxylesterase